MSSLHANAWRSSESGCAWPPSARRPPHTAARPSPWRARTPPCPPPAPPRSPSPCATCASASSRLPNPIQRHHTLGARSNHIRYPIAEERFHTPAPSGLFRHSHGRCDPGNFVAGGLVRARIVYSIRFGRSTPASPRPPAQAPWIAGARLCPEFPLAPPIVAEYRRAKGIGAGCIGRRAAGITPWRLRKPARIRRGYLRMSG